MKNKFLCVAIAALTFSAISFAAQHDLSASEKSDSSEVAKAREYDLKADLVDLYEAEAKVAIQRAVFTTFKHIDAIFSAFESKAEAAPATLNASSYLNFADSNAGTYNVTGVGTSDWVALPGQPTKTFHRVCIQNTSGATLELGNGASPAITRQFLIPPTAGQSAAPVCYPFGLTYLGSSVSLWIRAVHGGTAGSGSRITSGELIFNFLY